MPPPPARADAATVEALLFDLGGVALGIDFGRVATTWARGAGRAPDAVAATFEFDEAFRQHERGELDDTACFAHLDRVASRWASASTASRRAGARSSPARCPACTR
jgi:hypothetical protein